MIVGQALMAVLGVFFWAYALWPRLRVIRSLPYFWRGNLPPALEWRVFAAVLGLAFIAAAVLIGPPFIR
jgi:hypothetical protein